MELRLLLDDVEAPFALPPDFLPVADEVVLPVAPMLPDDLLPADLLLEPPDLLPEAELPDLLEVELVLLPLPDTAPWPMLVAESARDWLETLEPDERPLSVLPLVRPEVEPD
ncbi:hypothetical protein GCM10023186_10290 [Hymenobacter koreensis]|uniref:Uncharacterized protein n=1 Tax=Hymenobacter koreensis TaxID=1084523 RepID=A0ABP8IW32_9BACT